ncbi:MAG TPA: hypothetical protein VLE49_02490 [Anaerolineales bacterium]|nr:hypothetical protein [Anaerolineales bacterium]
MSIQHERQQFLFVVRIWQESDSQPSPVWRGMVEHVPFGQRMYFTSLNDLSDFIGLRLGKLLEPGLGQEES